VAGREQITETIKFGKYLRRIREERNLSLEAVEEMSIGLPEQVTKSHLSRIENGQAVPSFPRMFALSQVYGVPISSLAEKFEIDLRHLMFSPVIENSSEEDVLEQGKMLRRSGRYAEALSLYEALIDRNKAQPEATPDARDHLRLERINCYVLLARYAIAKEECEDMLNLESLSPTHKVITLQYLATSCYRLGKYTVAVMIVDRAETVLQQLEDPTDQRAHLSNLKGNIFSTTGRHKQASEAYTDAVSQFDQLSQPFEACRSRMNLAAALIEQDELGKARRHLHQVLEKAEVQGYDRLVAFAQSHLALIAYRKGEYKEAEARCLKSNTIGRTREYTAIVFRNCYYLLQIGRARGDLASIKTNERALRTYLRHVQEYLPEAEIFRSELRRGAK
jgi:tetratricopeptide (TPR) repeat protein